MKFTLITWRFLSLSFFDQIFAETKSISPDNIYGNPVRWPVRLDANNIFQSKIWFFLKLCNKTNGKYRLGKTPYLDTFHAVSNYSKCIIPQYKWLKESIWFCQEYFIWQEIWGTSMHLFKVGWNDHSVNYFPLMYRCGISTFNIFSCRILIISYKILIITGISNEKTN